jgi:hypothetical protein
LENGEIPDGDFMQTFLPYSDFNRSAASLDGKRLGKQRVETLQIMNALLTGKGWIHHPATVMWRGYEAALYEYQWAVCSEWMHVRGFKDTCMEKTAAVVDEHKPEIWHARSHDKGYYPWWLGMHKLHRSHRSNLIRKDSEFYLPQFGNVPDDLHYYWPKEETGIVYR